MASQEEINRLLEEENRLLRERLQAQSESYDLSSALVDSLKRVVGIRQRNSTIDQGILNLNRSINREILNQKIATKDINELTSQIKRNRELINKALLIEDNLSSKITDKDKYKLEVIKESTRLQSKYQSILDEINALDDKERKLRQNEINDLNKKILYHTENIKRQSDGLTSSTKQYFITRAQREELEKINKERINELLNQKEIEKKLGVTSGLLKGLSNFPILRDIVNSKDILDNAKKTIEQTGNGVKGLGTAFTTLGGKIKSSLTNSANITLALVGGIVNALIKGDKATGDLAKAFNITYVEANKLRGELSIIASLSGDTAITTKALQETIIATGNVLGTNVLARKDDLVFITQLAEKAGVAREEQMSLYKLSLVTGKSIKDNTGEFITQAKIQSQNNGIVLNEKLLLKDVNNISNSIKLSIGASGGELGKAAAAAKMLGTNLSQVDRIADSILQFESSISAELEAELLTGRQLNLEAARYYALTNDITSLSEELAKNVGSAAEFTRMNRIQQEAYAKSIGISREEMATLLIEREALKNLTGEEAEKGKEAFRSLVARVGLEQAQVELKNKSIEGLMQQQSIQERFNQTIEKLQDIFTLLVEPLLPVFDVFAGILKVVNLITLPLGKMMEWAQSVSPHLKTVLSLITGIGAATLLFAGSATLGLGVAAILAAVGTGMSAFESMKSNSMNQANDLIMTPSGTHGNRILTAPEGTFSLNNKDTIIAGTNLTGGKGKEEKNNVIIDLQPLLNEVKLLREAINNRPITLDIQLDGQSIAYNQTTGVNSFRI